jgi:hypothetical protein
MNFIKLHHRALIWLLVILAIPLTWYIKVHINYWGETAKYRVAYEAERQGLEEEYAQGRALDALEAADTYGGPTPQATWDLFVKALEAGDTDLASKYFVVEKQAEMKKFFNRAKELNKTYVLLDSFKTIREGRMSEDKKHFDYLTKQDEDGASFSFTLTINEKTNIWKLYDL